MVAVLALLGILTQFGPSVSPGVAQAATPSPKPRPSASPVPAAPHHRIRPSEIGGHPLPKPSPLPPRPRGVKSHPKTTPAPIAITPKPSAGKAVAPPPPATFTLTQTKPGKLLLKFQAQNADLGFDARAPFVIELNTVDPFKVEPSTITRENWPKSGNQLELTYSGQTPGKDNAILGKAAFTVCQARTKECRQVKAPIELHVR